MAGSPARLGHWDCATPRTEGPSGSAGPKHTHHFHRSSLSIDQPLSFFAIFASLPNFERRVCFYVVFGVMVMYSSPIFVFRVAVHPLVRLSANLLAETPAPTHLYRKRGPPGAQRSVVFSRATVFVCHRVSIQSIDLYQSKLSKLL